MANETRSYYRLRLTLRVLLISLILAGSAVTTINIIADSRPARYESAVTLTLQRRPERGYGAAMLLVGDRRVPLSDADAVRESIGQSLRRDESRTCLLRVSPGVSQRHVQTLRNLLASLTDGEPWDIRIVSLTDSPPRQSEGSP